MRATTDTIHKEPVILIGLKDFKNFNCLFHFIAQNQANMTCCSRRDGNGGKIIALLSYRAVINPVITCHVPIIITTGTPLTPI